MELREEVVEVEEELSIKSLLEAGAHFGHLTRRWNPKMKRYILEARNGIYIIDLAKTMQLLRKAAQVITEVVAQKKSVLFVGTKKQAKEVVRQIAESCDEFYVAERWLGGLLTNLTTIRQSVKKLERIEKQVANQSQGLTKKELAKLTQDQLRLEKNLSGIRAMRKPPGLIVVVDAEREHLAVAEGRKLGIPVMALVDTNADPDQIDHVIPCNDDALKSIRIILRTLANAIIVQKNTMATKQRAEVDKDEVVAEEAPLAQKGDAAEEKEEASNGQ